ncbi:ABC transporter ATP-binding protein [Hamadaea tsunoensis]|uniref:ABC transporter ATP-binding protein n=1 Tax=Hamadaea tsunoensis TaxID=53368 RepID=UPI00042687F4|nr:ABC transporter ATP-binding protein [Hamadaea tsunoensis]
MTTTAATTADLTTQGQALTVTGLTVQYGGVRAVDGIDFTVEAGQAVGVIGSNGAGKTSTLKALMGLIPRKLTSLQLGDKDLSRVKARDMVRHGIGYVPEGRHVFAGLPVEKNLLLGAYAKPWNAHTRTAVDEVYELFPVLGEMRHRLAGALSGGQQQMLAIGRALMAQPSVLLLDEPSMGLSPKLVGEIARVLQRLSAQGLTMLLVEQNAKLTFDVTSTCLVMENGKVAMTGTSTELSHDSRVRQIYLGL